MKAVKDLLKKREAAVFLLLVVLVLGVGIVNPIFLKPDTLKGVLDNSLILILIATGEMFVLLTAGIDVSLGAVTGLSAVVAGLSLNAGISYGGSILLAVGASLAAGIVNGFGVALLEIPPIIMTLGMMGVLRGLMYIITGGSWIDTIPTGFKNMSGVSFAGISVFAWIVIVMSVVMTAVVKRFKSARIFYYIGDNEEGAFFMGISVKRGLFFAYSLAGLFAGLAGIVFVSRIGFIPMQTGSGQELRAIAACVLGGVSLSGGVGIPLSALIGGLFLTTIDSVLVFLKVPAFWNDAIAGAILLVVVLLDFRFRMLLEVKEKKERLKYIRISRNNETGVVR